MSTINGDTPMRGHQVRVLITLAVIVCACGHFNSKTATAQAVIGVGDDALVLPRGVIRIRMLAQSNSFSERYGKDTPGRKDGTLEPIGVDFTLDTVGITQLPKLAPLQSSLRSLTGLSDFNLSLGKTDVRVSNRVTSVPLVMEAGLSNRFSMGLVIPIVRTQSEVFFGVNPNGNEGNIAFNPALNSEQPSVSAAALATNAALNAQFTAAAAALQDRVNNCQTNPSNAECTSFNVQQAQALIAASTAFSSGVSQIYNNSPFVPVTGSNAQLALEARVAAFDASYTAFGINTISTTGPAAAPNNFLQSDAQRLLENPNFGIVASPFATIQRNGIGDVELGGKFLLLDSFGGNAKARMNPTGFNYRFALGGIVRLPTGKGDSPNHFVDVGTGGGQTDFEVRAFSDLLFGRRFWQSFVVRYNNQLTDKQFMRITDSPNRQLAALYRLRKVERNLGNIFEFETTPRYVLNNYMSLALQYVYRNKGSDKYEGTFDVPDSVTGSGDITLNAATLNQETQLKEHRFGGGFSFSNLHAFEQGKARIPFEVTYLHFQTIKGSGGNVPKLSSDQIQMRLYMRLFGK